MSTRAVDLADSTLTVSVDDETEQVRTHVVTAKVVERLAEVGLVEVNVDVDEALEVLSRLLDQALAVRAVDASVAVVDSVVLWGLAGRSLQGNTSGGNHLERRQGE